MSTIDIVVPCYRYAHFLPECISSITNQSWKELRVLIIDDASPDDTSAVAESLIAADSRVNLLRHSSNKGHISTYNEGIEWAESDYLMILSADDYLAPGALERACELLDAQPLVGFAFGRTIEVDADNRRTAVLCPDVLNSDSPWSIMTGTEFIRLSGSANIVGTPTVIVRTSLQKQVGGYRQELTHSGDMEMWLRFAAHSSVGFVNAVQAVYRRHNCNMSIGYSSEGRLPDLFQRKAALDSFFGSCGQLLPGRREIEERVYWQLACDAVSLASAAFNEGSTTIVDQACEYALSIQPDIKWSRHWLALTCKRRVGLTVWQLLRPGVTRLRHAMSTLGAQTSAD